MSRVPRRLQQPMPPPGGWSPIQAAEILCPDPVALYRQGGETLDAVIQKDMHRLSKLANRDPKVRPDAWLTLQLLDAIRRRPDLQLTGRSRFAHLDTKISMDLGVLQAACDRDNSDTTIGRRWVHIDFRTDNLSSGRDYPATHLDDTTPANWADVRIEASGTSLAQSAELTNNIDAVVKPAFTLDRGRQWLIWVRESFSAEGKPLPSAAACWSAAKTIFSGHVPRDPFYDLHKEIAGADHRPGPRSGPRISPRATAEKLKKIKVP